MLVDLQLPSWTSRVTLSTSDTSWDLTRYILVSVLVLGVGRVLGIKQSYFLSMAYVVNSHRKLSTCRLFIVWCYGVLFYLLPLHHRYKGISKCNHAGFSSSSHRGSVKIYRCKAHRII